MGFHFGKPVARIRPAKEKGTTWVTEGSTTWTVLPLSYLDSEQVTSQELFVVIWQIILNN